MSKIYFDPPRRLSLAHYALIFVVATLVFACLKWPEEQKREGVIAAHARPILSASAYTNISSSSPPTEGHPSLKTEEKQVISEAADTPQLHKYGMAALGETGAWSGVLNEGRVEDAFGNVCRSTTELTTAQLKAVLPPWTDDPCGYRRAYWQRGGIPPQEVIANFTSFATQEIKQFHQSGLWATADFERIARERELSTNATLNVYLILKRAGSPAAELLVAKKTNHNGYNLDTYLETGKCASTYLGDVENFCFYAVA